MTIKISNLDSTTLTKYCAMYRLKAYFNAYWQNKMAFNSFNTTFSDTKHDDLQEMS